ncbi:hypothetical protein ABPG74_014644 [Tetrahymena malaccensis]
MIQFILISKQTNQKIYQEFQKNFFCCERQKNKQLAIYRANKNNDKKTYIFSHRKYQSYSPNYQALILTHLYKSNQQSLNSTNFSSNNLLTDYSCFQLQQLNISFVSLVLHSCPHKQTKKNIIF